MTDSYLKSCLYLVNLKTATFWKSPAIKNQSSLAALSNSGKFHMSQKSQLTYFIEAMIETLKIEPEVSDFITYRSDFINFIPTKSSKIVGEHVYMPH